MNDSTKTFKDTPKESNKNIPLSSVTFPRKWSFWESYIAKETKLSYKDLMKNIFSWNDLITFYQFWNKYPGNEATKLFFDGNKIKYFFKEKYRISAMNIFVEGIRPEWEDPKNNGGKYLQFEYQIKLDDINKFSNRASNVWKKLALNTMGENFEGSNFINGIRFIDKTQFERGKIIMFRFEIWLNKEINENTLNKLVDYLKKELGCEVVEIKDIKC
jgi:hypothetical protein